jgi:FtsP/CotA-like multicopper oxidase with cupredoxin domain
VLLLLGGGVLALALLVLGVLGWLYSRADMSTVGELAFENELEIPPALEPRVEDDGRKVFDLELQAGTTELLPGKTSETWGANGPYLAPTLRASRGDEVLVNVRNELPETTTTIHWHGMHLPAAADGGPHQAIPPDTTWSPMWTIDQPAATLWYHPHLHQETEEHVYRGITGMFLLDEPVADALPIPMRYGVDDIPVIIQDKRFDDNGSLDLSQSVISPTGILGSDILINGTYDPHVEVADSLIRFRLLNASNARVYNLGFEDDRPFDLIATEGGLLEAPEPMTRLQLSPGERAEIVAEFDPGEEVVLRSFEPELGTNFWEGRFSGADDSFDLVQVRADEDLDSSPRLPGRLVGQERVEPADATETRRFELQGNSQVNGMTMDPGRIDEVVERDTTEIWEVRNDSGSPHNFHIHGVHFRVLEYAGDPPPPELNGMKDTVYVPPNETVRVLTEFGPYTDTELPYMFHCHVLQHEDRGMMGQAVVVEPGQQPPPSLPEHDD